MDDHIQISKINDFIFCPYSVYLHSIYEDFNSNEYHQQPQIVGKLSHRSIDQKTYTTSKFVLQGINVYCEKYNLIGKIDTFDIQKGILVERKYKIKQIFDGYRFQLYAQMFSLEEMGFNVKKLYIQSLSDNKRYPIQMPTNKDIEEFERLIDRIKNYRPENKEKITYNNKCNNCIYKPLCH